MLRLPLLLISFSCLLITAHLRAQSVGRPLADTVGLYSLRKTGDGQINLRICIAPKSGDAFFRLYFLDNQGDLIAPTFREATVQVANPEDPTDPKSFVLAQNNDDPWLQSAAPIPPPYHNLRVSITLTDPNAVITQQPVMQPAAMPVHSGTGYSQSNNFNNTPVIIPPINNNPTLQKEFYDYAQLLQ